jgi:hypothetical protein
MSKGHMVGVEVMIKLSPTWLGENRIKMFKAYVFRRRGDGKCFMDMQHGEEVIKKLL